MPDDAATAVKALAVAALRAPEGEVRSTANNVVCTIARQPLAMERWPELMPTLTALLDDPSEWLQVSALGTIANVCEDLGAEMDSDRLKRPFDQLFPRLVRFMKHHNAVLRRLALAATLSVVSDPEDDVPMCVIAGAAQYLAVLSSLTTDPDADVRKVVCASLTAMLERLGEHVAPHIDKIISFFLHVCASDTPAVKLQATEFWSCVCEEALEGSLCRNPDVLVPYFPRLLPMLVSQCAYSAEELVDLPADDVSDYNEPDPPAELRPFLYKVDGDMDDVDQWTLRRCAVAQLRAMSDTYGEKVLPETLKCLNTCFAAGDDASWMKRDMGIRALGAISEGCASAIAPQLPALVPYLLTQLKDRRPLVRSGTCWTLARYGEAIAQNPALFNTTFDALLGVCGDRCKTVQTQTCAAILTFMLFGGQDLVAPHADKLLATFGACFKLYQAKNLLVLYDAVGQAAETLGPVLRTEARMHMLLPPLLTRWNALPDNDDMLPPLMECLTFVLPALGPHAASFAPELFRRSFKILEEVMTYVVAARMVAGEPEPDKVLVVATLDTIAGLYDALRGGMHAIVAPQAERLLQALQACCEDGARDVRMSAFALVGEMAVNTLPILQPRLPAFFPLLIKNMDASVSRVCNNCCWAFGELALRVGKPIAPMVPTVLELLAKVLSQANDETLPRSVLENTAVTMARMALQCPELFVEPGRFLFSWIRCAMLVEEAVEREHCFLGVSAVVCTFAPKLATFAVPLCHMVNAYEDPPASVKDAVKHMFAALKAGNLADYNAMLSSESMDKDIGRAVIAKYGPVL